MNGHLVALKQNFHRIVYITLYAFPHDNLAVHQTRCWCRPNSCACFIVKK